MENKIVKPIEEKYGTRKKNVGSYLYDPTARHAQPEF
jgi:hypothetical protein